MKNHRNLWIAVAVVVVIAIFGGLAVSSPWSDTEKTGSPCRFGFTHGKRHAAMAAGHMTDFALWRMDRIAEQLDLTQVQQEQYTEMRDKIKTQLAEGVTRHLSLKQVLKAEMGKESPDMGVLTQTLKSAFSDLTQHIGEGLDHFALFYDTLDDAQKAQVMDGIREKMARHDLRSDSNEEAPAIE